MTSIRLTHTALAIAVAAALTSGVAANNAVRQH